MDEIAVRAIVDLDLACADPGTCWRLLRRPFVGEREVRHGHWVPDRLVRLFNRRRHTYTRGLVHATVQPSGRVVDLPLSGRIAGAYVMTFYESGRCAFTRAGSGRDVIRDRYRSRAIGTTRGLRDLLEAHAESEAAVSLGEEAEVVETLEERLALGRRWYAEHGRTELLIPAAMDGVLLVAFVAFAIYLWVSGPG